MSGNSVCGICNRPFKASLIEEKIGVHDSIRLNHFFHLHCFVHQLQYGSLSCRVCKLPLSTNSIENAIEQQAALDAKTGQLPMFWPAHRCILGRVYSENYSYYLHPPANFPLLPKDSPPPTPWTAPSSN